MAEKQIPRHIGIIMDGNRRYAKKKGMDPWKGHEEGEKKFEQLLDWCKEFNIKELTLYTFSMQNFKRSKQEIDFLFALLKKSANKIINDNEFNKKNVRIRFIGRLHLFPKDLQEVMFKVMEKTKNSNGYYLNFAMGYGGREELVDATKAIVRDVLDNKIRPDEIDEEVFSGYLYLNSDPDLMIRTSGEKRTSNFLPWQSVYSEWCFVDKYWPAFNKEDFFNCIDDYSRRERRIGK